MKAKCPFKVGDRVKHILPSYGVGEVIKTGLRVVVEWKSISHQGYHDASFLQLVETPIQRMKRRYGEE